VTPVAPTAPESRELRSSRPRRRRKRRILAIAALALLAIGALAVALGAHLLYRPAGARFAVERLQTLLPGKLSVGEIVGNVGSRLELLEVRYQPPALEGQPTWSLRAGRLVLRWNAHALLRRTLSIQSLIVEDVELSLPPAPADPRDEPTELPELVLPLRLRLGEAEIRGLRVTREGEAPVELARLIRLERARVAAGGGPVRFRELAVDAERWRAAVWGELHPTGAYPLVLDATWAVALELAEPDADDPTLFWLAGTGPLRGDARRIEVAHEVTLSAATPADPTAPEGLRAELRGLLLDPLDGLRSQELTLSWDRIRWPLRGESLLASERGTLVADGTLENLALRLQASVDVPRLPRSEWRVAGVLQDLERLLASTVHGELLGGTVDGRAEIVLGDGAWSVELAGERIDPSRVAEDWPGRLAFSLAASGQSGPEPSSIRLAVDSLRGELRGYPVSGEARLVLDGSTIAVEHLDASSGQSQLTATGTIGESWELEWRLDAEDLQSLHPDVGGALQAAGQLLGSRSQPVIAFTFEGEALSWLDRSATRASGSARLGAWPGGPAEITVEAVEIVAPELRGATSLERLELEVEGTRDAHRIVVAARGSGVTIEAEAAGALLVAPDRPSELAGWAGVFDQLRLDLQETALAGSPAGGDSAAALDLGAWTLLSPGARLEIGRDGASVAGRAEASEDDGSRQTAPACFARLGRPTASDPSAPPARLCLDGTWRPESPWQVEAAFEDLPLALLAPWLPEGTVVERGASSGRGSVDGYGARIDQAVLRVDRASALVRVAASGEADSAPWHFDLLAFSGEAELDSGGIVATAQGSFEDGGSFELEMAMPGYTIGAETPLGEHDIEGRVVASLPELERWAALVPALELETGRLDAELDIRGTIANPGLDGRLELRDLKGRLADLVLAPEALPVDVPFSTPSLVARTTPTGATIEGRFRLEDPGGAVDARIELPGYSPLSREPWHDQPLAGTVDLTLDSLDPLARLLPRLSNTRGQLEATLSLGGTLGAAEAGGKIVLADFAAEVPELGLELREGQLQAEGRLGEALTLSGSLRSGPGTLQIGGSVQAVAGELTAEISFRGQDLAVMNTPDVRLRASPDLVLVAAPGTIGLSGEVVFPWARIDLRELPPTAARTSPDVVVVGRETMLATDSATSAAQELALTGRVRVRFGEDFQFRGFGFETEPRGALLVTVPVRGPTTASGQLRLDGGLYRAYGQNLEIESGRVVFGGGPITNPGLDVTAYRTVNGTRAGVEIGGTLERPVIDLIADRPMSETEILHYVVLGRAPGQTSEADSDVLAQAAAALSLRAGNQIARNLAARYGFDELRLEGGLDDASLVVGRFLSPRLYVSYGVGLFEAISTFTVRYVLTKHLTLVADTGRGTGASLQYTVEAGKRKGEEEEEEKEEEDS
jgi:translocation and assembly module TamB